jgi:6-phosphogluconolactonase/glucosamine-6-phosphate isomerase/deaminase
VLNAAKTVCFLAAGKEKAPILRDILRKRGGYPAQNVQPRRGHLIWMVDRAIRSQNLIASPGTSR